MINLLLPFNSVSVFSIQYSAFSQLLPTVSVLLKTIISRI
jgi:hypothetical protein